MRIYSCLAFGKLLLIAKISPRQLQRGIIHLHWWGKDLPVRRLFFDQEYADDDCQGINGEK